MMNLFACERFTSAHLIIPLNSFSFPDALSPPKVENFSYTMYVFIHKFMCCFPVIFQRFSSSIAIIQRTGVCAASSRSPTRF